MSQFPESALIEAGFLRRRCSEAVNLECPVCGTVANDLSLADCTGGMTCGTCGQSSAAPRSKCARCKEMLSSTPMGRERECLSLQAYRSRGDPAAFAPEEPLWAFKRETSGAVEVAAESDLKRRFASGELDSSVLVRGVDQPDFIKADACPEFREVARPRPAPEPVNPLWEDKALVGSVGQTARQSELVQWFLDGRLDAETLVRKNGRGIFVLAGRHPLFTSIARPRAVPQPPAPAAAPPIAPAPLPAPPLVTAAPAKPKGNRWILILLIFLFWPAAIWYGLAREFSSISIACIPISARFQMDPGGGLAAQFRFNLPSGGYFPGRSRILRICEG